TAATRRSAWQPARIRRPCCARPWARSRSAASRSSPRPCTTSSSSKWGEPSMHKILMVLRREYLERVRKKSFWVGTLIFPLLMGSLIFGQFALMALNPEEQKKLVLIDETGTVAPVVAERLSDKKLKDGRPE